MSHAIIIRSGRYAQPTSPEGPVDYTFEYYPSHDLPDHLVDKRVAKIRRVLSKLTLDITDSAAVDED